MVSFANANVACGTDNLYSWSSNPQSSTSVASAPLAKPPGNSQKGGILLQQLQQDRADIKPQTLQSQWQSQGISIADLLQTPEPSIESSLLSINSPASDVSTHIASDATLDISSPGTLELLAQAGIQQPGKRNIQLHSDLVRNMSTQQKSVEQQTPIQVFIAVDG